MSAVGLSTSATRSANGKSAAGTRPRKNSSSTKPFQAPSIICLRSAAKPIGSPRPPSNWPIRSTIAEAATISKLAFTANCFPLWSGWMKICLINVLGGSEIQKLRDRRMRSDLAPPLRYKPNITPEPVSPAKTMAGSRTLPPVLKNSLHHWHKADCG